MAIFSKVTSLVLGAAAASAAVLPERAVTPFFYFSFGDSYTTTGFNINGVQPAPGNPLGNPAYGQGTVAGGPNYVVCCHVLASWLAKVLPRRAWNTDSSV